MDRDKVWTIVDKVCMATDTVWVAADICKDADKVWVAADRVARQGQGFSTEDNA